MEISQFQQLNSPLLCQETLTMSISISLSSTLNFGKSVTTVLSVDGFMLTQRSAAQFRSSQPS